MNNYTHDGRGGDCVPGKLSRPLPVPRPKSAVTVAYLRSLTCAHLLFIF